MIAFLFAFTVWVVWGTLALGLALGAFTVLDYAHERLTGKALWRT